MGKRVEEFFFLNKKEDLNLYVQCDIKDIVLLLVTL